MFGSYDKWPPEIKYVSEYTHSGGGGALQYWRDRVSREEGTRSRALLYHWGDCGAAVGVQSSKNTEETHRQTLESKTLNP